MTAAELSQLSDDALRASLTACSGASHWVEATLASRPWADAATLLAAAERAWQGLTRSQLAEAVAHHPRLGESRAAATLSAQASAWSAGEQAGTRDADERTRAALAQGNRDYEARFGHTFILCASGRSAGEMLAALEARMHHDPATELDVTAVELWKITRLRLEKLLASA